MGLFTFIFDVIREILLPPVWQKFKILQRAHWRQQMGQRWKRVKAPAGKSGSIALSWRFTARPVVVGFAERSSILRLAKVCGVQLFFIAVASRCAVDPGNIFRQPCPTVIYGC